jgi:hypothetical protein
MPQGVTQTTKNQRAMFRRFLSAEKEREMWREFMESPDQKIRLEAFKMWNAYTYGKPLQPTEVSGADGGPVKIEFVT